MVEHYLRTPIFNKDVKRLKIKDVIYITGTIFTARDAAHQRALEYSKRGRNIPIHMKGLVLYHCGPLVKKVGKKWKVISAGPTTSARMEMFEGEFMEKFGVRVVIGKGGMGSQTRVALKKLKGVYCAFPGGAGAVAGRAVKEVKTVEWLDLGVPEALWVLEVDAFGPLIVAMDSNGEDMYVNVRKKVEEKRVKMDERI